MTERVQYRMPSVREMHRAIKNRDSAYDGVFLYGVVTTGVFCLPSCAARLPRPENVRFFLNDQQAVESGLRECKRCQPLSAEAQRAALIDLARYIAEHSEHALPLRELAQRAGLPASRLQKNFTKLFGVSPKAFQTDQRSKAFRSALNQGHKVADAIYIAGYGAPSRAYENNSRQLGMPPARFRAGGKGESISYLSAKTKLGWLMLAATDSGVCFVQFGASRGALKQALIEEFPAATLSVTNAQTTEPLKRWLHALEQHLSTRGPRPDLPLDLRGTAFQILVWKFLLQIPAGSVVSYADVARGVGRPGAVRAAASACGKNRIGVLIPCHRVLRGNGDLGGYRWGTDLKATLLSNEGH